MGLFSPLLAWTLLLASGWLLDRSTRLSGHKCLLVALLASCCLVPTLCVRNLSARKISGAAYTFEVVHRTAL
jgi:hypothetical protein